VACFVEEIRDFLGLVLTASFFFTRDNLGVRNALHPLLPYELSRMASALEKSALEERCLERIVIKPMILFDVWLA
jgi:hypothetical protein